MSGMQSLLASARVGRVSLEGRPGEGLVRVEFANGRHVYGWVETVSEGLVTMWTCRNRDGDYNDYPLHVVLSHIATLRYADLSEVTS